MAGKKEIQYNSGGSTNNISTRNNIISDSVSLLMCILYLGIKF